MPTELEGSRAPGPLGWPGVRALLGRRSPRRVALFVAGVGESCQDLACGWQLSDEDSAPGSPDPVLAHAFPLHLWHLGWHLCPPCLWGRGRDSYSRMLSGAIGCVEKLRQVSLKTDGPAWQVLPGGGEGQGWQVRRAGAQETAALDMAYVQTFSCLQASAPRPPAPPQPNLASLSGGGASKGLR